ncbi:uncharacterized protein [Palaemon carinicauda]|uniref:uncharacterized protein n=1 Tax=Palaemon carinicauda TaxID=392227 RepID=UPI0035B67D88
MFSVDLFFSDPKGKLNTIVCAIKSELLALAAKFEVTVSSRDRKYDIKNAILDYLVEEESVEEHEARKYTSTKKESSDVEHMRLAIQLEQVKLEVDIERERHKLAIDKERKKYELEMEKARLDHEASLTQNMEIERSRISVEQRIRLMNLESNQPLKFDLSKSLKLVPEFTETDVDSFFRNFEDIASNMKWPVDQWVWLIKSKVQGKAAIVVSNLVGERNYTVVKQAILDAYMVTAEGLRQRFRQYIKSNAQTWYEFANEKLRLFNKWLKAANVNNFEELVNLIVTEEFMRKLPQNIRMHIADREEEDLKKSAMLAVHFFLIHKTHKGIEMFVKQGKATGFSGEKEGVNYCSYCKQQGHDINECKNPTCKKSKFFGSKLSDPDAAKYKDSKFSVKGKGDMHCSTPESDALFANYISEGTVTIPNCTPVKVRILRDTGSTQSMILHSAVPTISLLDEKVLVRDLSNTNSLSLAELNSNCEFVSSKVKIAVINTPFPVHDVQVLLGNDLAGQLTLPNLILYNQPLDNSSNDLDIFEHFIEKSNFISDLGEHDIEEVETEVDNDRCDPIENFVGVVTRAKAKQAVNEGVPDIVKTNIPCTNSELINLQRADATLTNALKQASTKEGKVPGYYFDKGVLFRLYRPRKLSSNDTWANKEQLVVPLTLRKNILSVAHQADSHLGVSKTYKRIANDFFWPGMKHYVFEFVKECHVCQVVGKPNEVIPRAPLVPIVIPHEPFSKVLIDCVGPLPETKKGMSPFEMLFGHKVRGPLRVLKDKMLNNDTLDNVTVGQYVDKMKCNFEKVHNFAFNNLKSSQDVMKENFDLKTKVHSANQEILQNILVYLQHLPQKQRSQLAELFRKYRSICGDVPQRCSDAEHDIELQPGTRPIRQHYYTTSLEKQQWMKEEVSYLLKNGLVTRSTSAWASPCLLVPKPNDRAKLISAFITPFGLFQYERLPFGLTNAPATFQRLVNSVIQDLDGTYVYIDDIVVTSDTLDEHIHRLKALFGRLQEFGLTIHLAKSSFGKGKVKYLGHIIGSGEIVPKDENITAIVEFPVPRNRKSLLRFLGMTSYYRKFCKNYSIVATPLIDLTSPKNKFLWSSNCQQAFDQLKNILCSNPVLIAPDLVQPFIIQIDACDTGIGAVLMQKNSDTCCILLATIPANSKNTNVPMLPWKRNCWQSS